MKRLAIIGTKEFAEQITVFALQTGNFEVVGYYDNIEPKGNIINGRPVLGTVEDAIEGYKNNVFDEIFIGVGYTRFDLREHFYMQLKGKVPFANIINSSVYIGDKVVFGEGVFIGANTYIANETVIEDNVFIHAGTTLGHNNTIGSHSYISGRFDTCGCVSLGKRCFVGVRCLVSDHVTICDDTWLGIGSLVLKNIETPGKYISVSRLMKIE